MLDILKTDYTLAGRGAKSEPENPVSTHAINSDPTYPHRPAIDHTADNRFQINKNLLF
jgi:hypothetical protein